MIFYLCIFFILRITVNQIYLEELQELKEKLGETYYTNLD